MKPRILIVSLGNGDPDLLNLKTLHTLREAGSLILRTEKHPIVTWLKENGIPFNTLDHLYNSSDDFDLLDRNISEYLMHMARNSDVVYAVSDAFTDHTVRALLKKHEGVTVSVVPGISSYDMILSSCADRLSDSAAQIVPASDFINSSFSYDPNVSLMITELDNQLQTGDVKLFLGRLLDDNQKILFLSDYDQPPVSIPLWKLDRMPGISHRSSVFIPASGVFERERFVLNDLMVLMDKLRSVNGCPWDRIQTHESLRPYLIEEAWECIASIDQNDMEHLGVELGDLLFQIVFHSSIASSYDEFTINDVISSICLKMIRRHPHVFGSVELKDADSVKSAWEKNKQKETGHYSAVSSLDDVSTALPSLKYASKLLKKLYGTSFVRSEPNTVLNDIRILISEMIENPDTNDSYTLGRLLLLCNELCFIKGYDSELLLHQAADQLKSNLKAVEKKILSDGKSLEHLTFDELGVYLNHVKDEIE